MLDRFGGTKSILKASKRDLWIPQDKTSKTNKLPSLDKLELEVLNLIEDDSAGLPTDLIVQKLNIGISETAPVPLKLEINGLIKATPGQIYVRVY